ncbi:hypothetical protein D3C75_1305390 [compost metagenome]
MQEGAQTGLGFIQIWPENPLQGLVARCVVAPGKAQNQWQGEGAGDAVGQAVAQGHLIGDGVGQCGLGVGERHAGLECGQGHP